MECSGLNKRKLGKKQLLKIVIEDKECLSEIKSSYKGRIHHGSIRRVGGNKSRGALWLQIMGSKIAELEEHWLREHWLRESIGSERAFGLGQVGPGEVFRDGLGA